MLPPAPGRFSMTTFCPHASVSFCAMMRPSVSSAAGGKRDQHAHRPLGIVLRRCAGAGRKQRSRDHRAGGASAHLVS